MGKPSAAAQETVQWSGAAYVGPPIHRMLEMLKPQRERVKSQLLLKKRGNVSLLLQ